MEENPTNKTKRLTCRCVNPGCKFHFTVEIEYIFTGWNYDRWGNKSYPSYRPAKYFSYLHCPKCKSIAFSKEIKGKFSPDHKCSARCTSALGADCECQCAGENHGIDHLQKI